MLEEASAETSERIIAVLSPRLEAMSRLVVGLHLEPAIRGDRRVRSKLEAAKCLDKVIAAFIPDTQVGPDSSLDVAVLRAQLYATETAQAAAERELAKEVFRRENAAASQLVGSKLKRKAATSPPAPVRKRIRRPLRVRDDDSESDSDFSVQESPPDPKKHGDVKAAVPAAPASLEASTSQPLQRPEVPSPASNTDRQSCQSAPLCSLSTPKVRSKTLSRDASRVSSPTRDGAGASSRAASRVASRASSPDRGRVLDLSGEVPPAARSTSSPTSSGALGSGGVSPALLVSTLQGIHSSPTSHSPRSLPALSGDESLATLVLSDDDVEIVDVLPAVLPPFSGSRGDADSGSVTGDTDGQRRGPVPCSKAASSEFRSALLLEALEADDDDVLCLTELSPASSQSTSRTQEKPPAPPTTRSSGSRGVSNGQVKVPAASITYSASSRGQASEASGSDWSSPVDNPDVATGVSGGCDHVIDARLGPQDPLPVPPHVTGASPIVRASKQVAKWAQPFISPKFHRPVAATCWVCILNCRLPSPVPAKTRVPCTVATLEAFVDYTNPSYPWQRLRRSLPPQAFLFDPTSFDLNYTVSQRAPVPLRLRGYWRMFRVFGNETDAAMGFAMWERDHWVPTRAVEVYFEVSHRALEDAFDEASRPALRSSVDAAKGRWLAYVRERAQRSDRLRQKLIYTVWEWCLSDRFPHVETELMFEPSMPGISLGHLTWTPKTADWVSELSALEEREPWRNGWTEVPVQHPYNTTSSACNPSCPLFVPVGFPHDAVCGRVVLDLSLDPHEISTSWPQVSSAPSSPDESSSGVPLLSTCPVHNAPTSDGQLHLLVKVTMAAPDDVTEI
ncbi:unnamed protein product [Phytophthora fragariaefolia]|uniref:Unnamed protein product n=1 Tax=Phytophthora fragariaefolia TaxID=1490495 RepID=A0A9W6X3Q0_9STRA|nr:unnamed protein product [Phytophthora fragariaefolia]